MVVSLKFFRKCCRLRGPAHISKNELLSGFASSFPGISAPLFVLICSVLSKYHFLYHGIDRKCNQSKNRKSLVFSCAALILLSTVVSTVWYQIGTKYFLVEYHVISYLSTASNSQDIPWYVTRKRFRNNVKFPVLMICQTNACMGWSS